MVPLELHIRNALRSICFYLWPESEECKEVISIDETCQFDRLPAEIIEKILCRLGLKDCCPSRLVCSKWYEILDRKIFIHFKLSQRTLTEFGNVNFRIDRLTVRIHELLLEPFLLVERDKNLLAGVSTLVLEGSPLTRTAIYNLPIRQSEAASIGNGVKALVFACRDVKYLKFDLQNVYGQVKMKNPFDVDPLTLKNLHTLQLLITYNNDSLMLRSIFRLNTPCLQVLQIERVYNHSRVLTASDRKAYIGLFKFIGRNKGTLRALKLVNLLPNIYHSEVRPYLSEKLLMVLSEVKLFQLEIAYAENSWRSFCDCEHHDHAQNVYEQWIFIDSLLLSQKSLRALSIKTDSMAVLGRMYNVLENNAWVLRKLSVELFGAASDVVLDCSKLKCLQVLHELSLDSKRGILNSKWLPTSVDTLRWNVPFDFFPMSVTPSEEDPPLKGPKCLLNLRKIFLGTRCQQLMDLENVSAKLFSSLPKLEQLSMEKCKRSDQARNQRMIRRSCLALERRGILYININDKFFNMYRMDKDDYDY